MTAQPADQIDRVPGKEWIPVEVTRRFWSIFPATRQPPTLTTMLLFGLRQASLPVLASSEPNTNARAGLALAADRLVDGGGVDAERFGRHAPALASYRQSMCFQISVKPVSVNERVAGAPPDTELMDFVDQMGGYFESSGFPRLGGRLLGWLLVCDPERQSSEELAAALGASSGGISTNARMLSQFGFIERLAVAGDRRSYFRLRPHAFAAGERQRIRTMADLRAMADAGLHAMRGSPPERGRRLQEMRDLSAYMETVLTNALDQFGDQTKENSQ